MDLMQQARQIRSLHIDDKRLNVCRACRADILRSRLPTERTTALMTRSAAQEFVEDGIQSLSGVLFALGQDSSAIIA